MRASANITSYRQQLWKQVNRGLMRGCRVPQSLLLLQPKPCIPRAAGDLQSLLKEARAEREQLSERLAVTNQQLVHLQQAAASKFHMHAIINGQCADPLAMELPSLPGWQAVLVQLREVACELLAGMAGAAGAAAAGAVEIMPPEALAQLLGCGLRRLLAAQPGAADGGSGARLAAARAEAGNEGLSAELAALARKHSALLREAREGQLELRAMQVRRSHRLCLLRQCAWHSSAWQVDQGRFACTPFLCV
jgi:hypothetical protein